ncbi:MAG: MAPEG family protein [Gammaproteobacteria bacterium]|nr:MAPEG family protein [Gammaproteobacteria bacterium]
MLFPVTAIYAGLLFFVLLVLGYKVGSMRGKTGISINYGDNLELATAMRRHANFVENVPLALILMAIVEANGAGATFLHAVGIALVLMRIAHPLGLHHDNMGHPLRLVGAGGTILLLLILAVTALWQALPGLWESSPI